MPCSGGEDGVAAKPLEVARVVPDLTIASRDSPTRSLTVVFVRLSEYERRQLVTRWELA